MAEGTVLPRPPAGVAAELYARHITPMRERARELGYALTVHGSLARDVDVVAVPWAIDVVPPAFLMRALKDLLGAGWTSSEEMNQQFEEWYPGGVPPSQITRKPHGRVSCSLYLTSEVYVDLSVMPREPPG